MKILIACEFSGIVREAFKARGHDAWSCDLLPTEILGNHIQDDVLKHLDDGWDMMIAFPPCTHLACSGARHFEQKRKDGRQQQGIDFFIVFTQTNIFKWAIENPVGIMSTIYRKPDQIIQPWQFGNKSRKTTCLWLNNLPPLLPTQIVTPDLYICKNGKTFSRDYLVTGKNCGKIRSKTYPGIAKAMAEQWG